MSNNPLPLPETYWVIPGQFLAGQYPTLGPQTDAAADNLTALLQAGLTTFINLTQPEELPDYQPLLLQTAARLDLTVTCLRFPISDLGLPTHSQMVHLLDSLDSHLSAGNRLYLHCWGGIGRTGTTVATYLVRHGLTGSQALNQLAAWWRTVPKSARSPRSPETPAQRQFVLDWVE